MNKDLSTNLNHIYWPEAIHTTTKTVNTSKADWKLYALQRKDKDYALKLLKPVNEMEKLLFDEPKSYQQTLLNFYH